MLPGFVLDLHLILMIKLEVCKQMWSRSSRDIKWAIPKKSLKADSDDEPTSLRQWPQQWMGTHPTLAAPENLWASSERLTCALCWMPSSTVPITASNGVPCPVIFPFGRLYNTAYGCAWASGEQINAELVEQCESLPDVRRTPVWWSLIASRSESESKGRKRGLMVTRRWKRKRHIVVDVLGLVLLRQRRERCRC